MSFIKTLTFGIRLLFYESKIIYPSILSLLPTALFAILFAFSLTKVTDFLLVHKIEDIVTNRSVLLQLLNNLVPNFVLLFVLGLFSLVIFAYLVCVYSDIGRAKYRKRKVDLALTLSSSWQRVYPLLSSYFLGFFLILSFSIVLFLISIPLKTFFAFTLILIIIALVSIPVFWILPAVVVFENKSGFDSLKRSLQISKQFPLKLYATIIILEIIVFLIDRLLLYLPFAGIYASMISRLFLLSWRILTIPSFYYENVKFRRTKEEDYI